MARSWRPSPRRKPGPRGDPPRLFDPGSRLSPGRRRRARLDAAPRAAKALGMKTALPIVALLLATACSTTANEDRAIPVAGATAPEAPPPAAADPAAEDARLLAFLDSAFDEAVASSPET